MDAAETTSDGTRTTIGTAGKFTNSFLAKSQGLALFGYRSWPQISERFLPHRAPWAIEKHYLRSKKSVLDVNEQQGDSELIDQTEVQLLNLFC